MGLFTRTLPNLLALFHLIFTINAHTHMSKLLLISFDGFRWDYLDKAWESGRKTPHFNSLIQGGVRAKYGVKNVFVTKTFPNHYSLVTGMYQENHGVVGNNIYDPTRGVKIDFTSDKTGSVNDEFWWNNGTDSSSGPQPIWVTNQKNRKSQIFKRRTGVMFWPGSTAKRKNEEEIPDHYFAYNSSMPNKTRIDYIVEWFASEEDPINLGLLYFSEPDHLGHQVGPDHPRMMDMIVELDGLIGYLIQELKKRRLFDEMNIVITSDHGMANIEHPTVYLPSHIPNLEDLVHVCVGHSPGLNIIPKAGKTEELLNQLKNISTIDVYTKETMPSEFRYKYNARILNITVSAKMGYDITCGKKSGDGWTQGGNHGYNNSIPEMHPFFIAHGPAFKENFVTEKQFNSVDIYPMMCHILDIEPGPHDGRLDNIDYILSNREEEEEEEYSTITVITFLAAVMFAATISGMFSLAACRVYRITKLKRRSLVLPMSMVAGKTPLLASDDEEIP